VSRDTFSCWIVCLGMVFLVFFGGYSQPQPQVHASESEKGSIIRHSNLPIDQHRHDLNSILSVQQSGFNWEPLSYNSEAMSSNYAGYEVHQGSGNFSTVSGSWTMPTVKCPLKQSSEAAFWVGLTGRGGQSTIAQVATIGSCQNGQALYEADWELFPATAQVIDNPIRPGDNLSATVTYGNGTFHLALSDVQQAWSFSIAQSGNASNASIAECITEAPTLVSGGTQTGITNLANFGSVSMSCLADEAPIGSYSELFQYQMIAENAIGSTSALDSAGSNFSVTWEGK
jgi:Peptidase A4 family